MSVKTNKSQSSFSGVITLAFVSLLSSAAYSQNNTATNVTQIWADPGALEKARRETTGQTTNGPSAPVAAIPVSSKSSLDRSSASPTHKPTKSVQSSSLTGEESLNKLVHDAADHKAAHRTGGRPTEVNHVSSSGRVQASSAINKTSTTLGHNKVAQGGASHVTTHLQNSILRPRVQHTDHGHALEQQSVQSPVSPTPEFDPIYGYTNMISVAY